MLSVGVAGGVLIKGFTSTFIGCGVEICGVCWGELKRVFAAAPNNCGESYVDFGAPKRFCFGFGVVNCGCKKENNNLVL